MLFCSSNVVNLRLRHEYHWVPVFENVAHSYQSEVTWYPYPQLLDGTLKQLTHTAPRMPTSQKEISTREGSCQPMQTSHRLIATYSQILHIVKAKVKQLAESWPPASLFRIWRLPKPQMVHESMSKSHHSAQIQQGPWAPLLASNHVLLSLAALPSGIQWLALKALWRDSSGSWRGYGVANPEGIALHISSGFWNILKLQGGFAWSYRYEKVYLFSLSSFHCLSWSVRPSPLGVSWIMNPNCFSCLTSKAA